MAIESGLGWSTFTVEDSGSVARDIRSDVFTLDWTMPRGVQDITALSQSAMARLLLLADFSGTSWITSQCSAITRLISLSAAARLYWM